MERSAVITGLGAACALGAGIDALWDGLVAGRTALGPIERFDAGGFPCRLAGEARGISAKDVVPKSYRKAVKVMARDIELAVVAAHLAVKDAGLVTRCGIEETPGQKPSYPGARVGCQIGAGMIACEVDELTMALATSRDEAGRFCLEAWGSEDGGRGAINNLQPLWLLKYLPNMLACHVTILHGAEGPSNTITCGEASGLLSIGESARVIERGDADASFAGGAESRLNPMGFLRMGLAGRLADTGTATDGASLLKPYDPASAGGILGEGGGIVVLEEARSASARHARPYARVAGFGAAQSLAPHYDSDDGLGGYDPEGLASAIEAALADARITPNAIDAIVPHASGVAGLDDAEADALERVFASRLASIPLVTLSPNIGNTLAGNGGLAVAAGARAIRDQRLPARVHRGSPRRGMQAGAGEACPARLRHVLIATNSMGGQNAAIVLSSI